MPKVKREVKEEDSKPAAKRIKKEEDQHEDEQGAVSILARLDALEGENRKLRAQVTTLKALASPLKLVEFKFRSCKTHLVDEGCMAGTLHVPMLQDPFTGRFTLPVGTTQATGVCQHFESAWHLKNNSNGKTEHFTATFVRKEGEPISRFHLGYALDWWVENWVCDRVVPMDTPISSEYASRAEFTAHKTHREQKDYIKDLDAWEKHSGGMLSVSVHGEFDTSEWYRRNMEKVISEANYKIKLYTVLSAHKPNEEPNPLEPDANPNWTFLEQVVKARFPNRSEYWALKAVREYVNFLELKKEHSDCDSSKFSPSGPIDEVWHAHLSFIDRYQHDVRALTGSETLIEHSPVLGEEAFKRYEAAYKVHVDRMKTLKKDVNKEFWPEPKKTAYEEDHDGDSDDHLDADYHPSCG